jgi:hypothetical protein
LGVLLLSFGQIPGEVFDGWSIFHGQPVGLSFHSEFVDQHSGICRKTRKGKDRTLIDSDNLANCSGVLKSLCARVLNNDDEDEEFIIIVYE